jgi:death-on-curing protein
MKEPVWVLREVVLTLHDVLLAEYGGPPGIRDETLLDSALARPHQIFHYEDPDLFTLATAYIYGILKNHPFIDGNKRTAFMTGFVFLARNGKPLNAPEAETTQAVLDLTAGNMTEATFALWLKQNCES